MASVPATGRPPPPAPPRATPPLLPEAPATVSPRPLSIAADADARGVRQAPLYVEGYAATDLDERGVPWLGALPRWRWTHPGRSRAWPEEAMVPVPPGANTVAVACIDVDQDRRMDAGDRHSAAWSPAPGASVRSAARRILIDRVLHDRSTPPGPGGEVVGSFAGR